MGSRCASWVGAEDIASLEQPKRGSKSGAGTRSVRSVAETGEAVGPSTGRRVHTALSEQCIFRTNVSGCCSYQQISTGEQSGNKRGQCRVRVSIPKKGVTNQITRSPPHRKVFKP